MIKNFKFAGVALLVVGLTFAASSCQKQDFIENQDENQVVDLNEFTKAPVDEVAEATANVEAALADIFSSLSKMEGVAVESVHGQLQSFFQYGFKGGCKFAINKEFFKSLYTISVDVQNGRYDVNLSREEGAFKISTPKGYYILATLPDAYANFTNRGISGHVNGTWQLYIGKDEDTYAHVVFNIMETSKIYANLYDKSGNEVAGTVLTYDYKTYKPEHFAFWYNNRATAGDECTDFAITDFSKVFNALKEMSTIFNPYTKEEAEKIANKFNTYFTSTDKGVALFKGKEFKAEANSYKTVSGEAYRVDLMWGDKWVSAIDVCTFLYEYFKSIIEGNYADSDDSNWFWELVGKKSADVQRGEAFVDAPTIN